MKYILICSLLLLYACSNSNTQLHIEDLENINGIYTYQGKKYAGTAYSYFPKSNRVKRNLQCTVSNNSQVCTEEEFNIDGSLSSYTTLKDGKKEGIQKQYTNGKLLEKKYYIKNQPHGTFTSYYTTTGNKEKQEGQIQVQGTYLHGAKEGEWKEYYPDGTLRKVANYKQNQLHGSSLSYYPEGSLQEQGNYQQGNKEGEWNLFYENGQLQSKSFFENDKKHGKEIRYHANSLIHEEILFVYGIIQGKVRTYDENGKLQRTVYYDTLPQEEIIIEE